MVGTRRNEATSVVASKFGLDDFTVRRRRNIWADERATLVTLYIEEADGEAEGDTQGTGLYIEAIDGVVDTGIQQCVRYVVLVDLSLPRGMPDSSNGCR